MMILVLALLVSNSFAGGKLYSVEFRGADIKGAVQLLTNMAKLNVVLPEKMDSKVTASFQQVALLEALDAILKTHGFGFVQEGRIIRVVLKGEDLAQATFNLEHAKAAAVLPHIKSLVSERGSAIADERTNSVHVRATRSVLADIRDLVTTLDRKDKQVLIEAKIIEASVDFVRSLGIQWGVTARGGKVQTAGLTAVGASNSGRSLMFNAPAQGSSAGPPLGGVGLIVGSLTEALGDIQISVAEQKGDLTILSRPSITTVNNQQATIRSGTKFFVRIGAIGGAGATDLTANLRQIETGIELKVTPQISDHELVKLTIEATASEADFTRAIEGVPAIVDNTAQTTVVVQDGETTIIGGLFNVRDAKTVRGIPGLMEIPLMGNLFKGRTRTKAKTELLIFITPKIIENSVTQLPQ